MKLTVRTHYAKKVKVVNIRLGQPIGYLRKTKFTENAIKWRLDRLASTNNIKVSHTYNCHGLIIVSAE